MHILSRLHRATVGLIPQTGRSLRWLCLLSLLVTATAAYAASPVHHELQIILQPENAQLEVTDRITLPKAVDEIEFLLHDGLAPGLTEDKAGKLHTGIPVDGPVPLRNYRLTFNTPTRQFTLSYAGNIHHPLETLGETASTRQSSFGIISPEGVFLAGASYWYPTIDQQPVNFSMQVQLPSGWRSVSQGTPLPSLQGWQESTPQEEIYLVAAPYRRYHSTTNGRLAEVYLREQNPGLAERYLQMTHRYLEMYESLLGPYPYAKFALVENFWESGYGMPSFTLLGPRVIRLPFIPYTSYPHEILHNWWGNGVYVDPSSGNWSEGLTTYLADHLLKEQRGEGAAYRRHTLQDYASYVSRENDFPLNRFWGNHGQVSQSVGYGKTLMLFHMLRNHLGDRNFIDGLRRFYAEHRFQAAGYRELQQAFEAVSGQPLASFFEQWLTRTGAPALELLEAHVDVRDTGYRTTLTLQQSQSAAPFRLQIPLFLELEGATEVEQHTIVMDQQRITVEISTRKRPLRLSVDPRFDLFRHLDPSEIPGSLGQLFGADKVLVILPAQADTPYREAYRNLVDQWQRRQPGLSWLWDDKLEELPRDRAVWIMGRENRFLDQLQPLPQEIDSNQGSLAAARQPTGQSGYPLGLLLADSAAAIGGLARKLPHYGHYGYVRFEGTEPSILERGEWPMTDNALSVALTPDNGIKPPSLPRHTPLTEVK